MGLVVVRTRFMSRGAKGAWLVRHIFRSHGRQGRDDKDAHSSLQDLQRKIYAKAKAQSVLALLGPGPSTSAKWKRSAPHTRWPKPNDERAPGIDGVTFEAIEAAGVDGSPSGSSGMTWSRSGIPSDSRIRRHEIPKDGGKKVRILSIPAIRDRVVQGALKLILEPVFEADFQPGSFGYRPKRTAHDAIKRVAEAIVQRKTRVLDFELRADSDEVAR